MPSSLDPRAGLAAAVPTIRLAYAAMLVQSLGVFVFAVSGGRLFAVDSSAWWQILLGVLAAYLVFDSAAVVLKARPMGRWLALILSGMVLALSGVGVSLAVSGGSALGTASCAVVLLAAMASIVAVLLPPSNRAFSAYQGLSLVGGPTQNVAAERKVPQDRKRSGGAESGEAHRKAKQQAVDAAVAKFGPGVADKAAEIAERVLADPQSAAQAVQAGAGAAAPSESSGQAPAGMDEAALNRAQRRAIEKARRTGKKPTIVQRVPR